MTNKAMKYEIEIAPNGGVVVRDDYLELVGAFGDTYEFTGWLQGIIDDNKTVDDGWIPNGGEAPSIDGCLMVQVKLRDGTLCGPRSAEWWRWQIRGITADITHYRVVSS